MATGRAIVKKAIEQLDQTLSPEDERFFRDTTLRDLWRDARGIESELGERRDLRYMRRIEGFLRTMESYSGVIEVFCQGFSPMAFVWGPIKLSLLLAKQYTGVMDKILQAYNDIANVLPRVDKLQAAFSDTADFQKMLSLIYTDVLEFNRRAYKMFRRKAWHIWFALDWGLFERRFKSILRRLESHCELLDKEALATHFLEMKGMREKRQFEEDTHEQQRDNQMTREMLAWLSADEDSQEEYLHGLSDQRQVGTCDWILKDAQVSRWIEDDLKDPVVWLTGIPGAGKSFLCSLIVQNSEIHEESSTVYYFCGQKPSSVDAPTVLLRTLAVQLLRQSLELASFVHQAYLQKALGRSAPTMKKLMKDLLSTNRAVRIVIDGIDEWNRTAQKDTLKALVELQKHGGSNCKLLIASRKEPWIRDAITHKVHVEIDSKSAEGLLRYIDSTTDSLQGHFQDFTPELWERLTLKLQDKACGMFLWVRLVKNMLYECSSEDEFEKAIEQLPNGLEEAYGRILLRLNDLSPLPRERALRILFWVCSAFRPIKIDEVVDGLALKPSQTILSVRTRSQNPERDVLELCAPILERTKDGTLSVVHFSAKDYLLNSHSGPFIYQPKAHLDIAFSCIVNITSALILVPRFGQSIQDTEIERLVATGSFGLHLYAHQYWKEHLVAYLCDVNDLNTCTPDEIRVLNEFCKVLKSHSANDPQPLSSQELSASFKSYRKLHRIPDLARLVLVWSRFKSKSADAIFSLETLENQQLFQLQHDETYLSLINQRLREIEERILSMDRCTLPPHISKAAHDAFIARYGFSCRKHECDSTFPNALERDTHELSHSITFPCLQCDFSGIGFRNKETLNRHMQKYHMSPEDFKVPDSLDLCNEILAVSIRKNSRSSPTYPRVSHSWSDQGRTASQQVFRRILAKVESRMSASRSDEDRQILDNLGQTVDPAVGLMDVNKPAESDFDAVRIAIEEQRYNTLHDFRGSVENLVKKGPYPNLPEVEKDIDAICNDELTKVISGFPAFADTSATNPRRETEMRLVGEDDADTRDRGELRVGPGMVQDPVNLIASGKRVAYWSAAEEKKMPELLDRYGRDLIKIAEYLKTKTLAEIDLHLIDQYGYEKDPPPLQDRKEEAVPSRSEVVPVLDNGPILTTTIMDPSNPEPYQQTAESVPWPPRYPSQLERGVDTTHHGEVNGLAHVRKGNSVNLSDDAIETAVHPKKATRRPPRKWQCHFCGKECYDEYVAKKHIARLHTPTRQVWICVDRSMTKTFFSPCKSCKSEKQYSTKRNAMKHLRDFHFVHSTTEQTLLRWITQLEVPNPKFVEPKNQSSKVSLERVDEGNENASSSLGPAPKRRKVEHIAPIRNLPELTDDLRRLPRIRSNSHPSSSNSRESTPSPMRGVHDGASGNFDADLVLEKDQLGDVSFDHLLPVGESETLDTDDGLESFDKQLIRPRQVHRLPHLDKYHQTLCLDQVKALYDVLTTLESGSPRCKEADEELVALSRTLRRDLNEWRHRSSFAPKLPFSL